MLYVGIRYNLECQIAMISVIRFVCILIIEIIRNIVPSVSKLY